MHTLEGHFVNMASCSLYPEFDRSLNYTDAQPDAFETIFVGIDINVGNSVLLNTSCVVVTSFTSSMRRSIATLSRLLRVLRSCIRTTSRPGSWYSFRMRLVSSVQYLPRRKNRTLGILKKAGHKVSPQQSNPLVQDRINAVNVLVESRKIKVGNGCKNLIRTFEQHAYDDKGKPEKGGVGMDDLSHSGDAAGYAVYRLAAIRQWKTGSSKSVRVW